MTYFFASQQEISRKEKIFSFLVVFFAFAHTYCIPGLPITFGEVLVFACIPFYIKHEMRFPFDKQEVGFVFWFVYMSIISMILGIVFDAPLSKYFSIARAGIYWVIIFYFGKNLFNRKVFEKWMIVFSVVLSSYIIVQFVVFTVTGFYIPGLISGLRISNGAESSLATYQHTLNMAKWFGYIRPHGFLGEPAQCVQFLFICMVTLIYNNVISLKNKILLAVLFSSAILITQSTTGIVLLGLAWILFFSIEKKLSVYKFPLVLLCIAIGFYIIWGGVYTGLSSVDRIENIVQGSADGSSNIRLNNGMQLYSDLPFVFQIFGTGAGLAEYVFYNLGFNDASSYMNAFVGIFFSTGVIGGIIWIASLAVMFVMSGLLGKSLVVGFFIMSLGCSIFCQPQMVWFFLLILADVREKNENNLGYTLS